MASLSNVRCRFAPSITGSAHPGTLLAALLCWLDARSQSGHVLLRLEDLDVTRLRPGQSKAMVEALEWLGLDWDEVHVQSELAEHHEAALDALEAGGHLYACQCSRKEWQARGERAPDGGIAYDNHCRKGGPLVGWRDTKLPIRVRLPDERIQLADESGLDLSQAPATAMGDPVVRRRDGVIAYHLVVVVDDARSGINRIVRGRDLATTTATQVALRRLLSGVEEDPTYRHHFLLLEEQGKKLAKLHRSAPYEELRKDVSGPEFCGLLAGVSGLRPDSKECSPQELLADFDWSKVRSEDYLWG
jgi:glutamyl-tRNA synthetase/glutamyl-Q tRNA(Asp) synthetase